MFRHEIQEYADVAAIVGETKLANRKNDQIFVESLNRAFYWKQGSTLAHDGVFVIEQTSESANGRWVASSASEVLQTASNAPVVLDDLEPGQGQETTVTVTGALLNKPSFVAILSAVPNDFEIEARVSANNTVKISYRNQGGAATTGLSIQVSVIVL